ncbi:hypothetical protein EDB81DRAFT_181607 [Dactylonectria macrodidyma]|uniref:Uncharacterized protein n=1 Tax=Dactylonectria macrodidyma TaxID=307937 RepID=A0A9P9JLG2_9HYPO|nr:hypothetical protein EDB81DRAFT_181607 [Dactylonectria macrodidyma]
MVCGTYIRYVSWVDRTGAAADVGPPPPPLQPIITNILNTKNNLIATPQLGHIANGQSGFFRNMPGLEPEAPPPAIEKLNPNPIDQPIRPPNRAARCVFWSLILRANPSAPPRVDKRQVRLWAVGQSPLTLSHPPGQASKPLLSLLCLTCLFPSPPSPPMVWPLAGLLELGGVWQCLRHRSQKKKKKKRGYGGAPQHRVRALHSLTVMALFLPL